MRRVAFILFLDLNNPSLKGAWSWDKAYKWVLAGVSLKELPGYPDSPYAMVPQTIKMSGPSVWAKGHAFGFPRGPTLKTSGRRGLFKF
jgi:hypothetical protein